MSEFTRKAIAAILTGGITTASALAALLQETALEAITPGQWVSIGLFFFISAGTGVQTLLKAPRKDG